MRFAVTIAIALGVINLVLIISQLAESGSGRSDSSSDNRRDSRDFDIYRLDQQVDDLQRQRQSESWQRQLDNLRGR